jgi:hypothetical protein
MRVGILLAVVTGTALAAGCGPCDKAYDLTFDGGPASPRADVVVQVAQAHCSRPIVGIVRWTTGEDKDGKLGHCSWAAHDCPMDAWVSSAWEASGTAGGVTVTWWHTARDATETVLAHEIGHWCLLSEDEDAVNDWAYAVNSEAQALLR